VNVHHRRALQVLLATAVADVVLGAAYGYASHIGFWHGLYCATGTATTVGCDVALQGWLPHAISAVMMLTVVPLFASVFAFFTTGLTADHIDTRHTEMKEHVTITSQPYEERGGS
jgi:hypothetical protein